MYRLTSCLCLCLALGCKHTGPQSPVACNPCDTPSAQCTPPPCPPPQEVCKPSVSRVTLPAPKVVVEMPDTTVVQAPQQSPPQMLVSPQAAFPQSTAALQLAPAQGVPQLAPAQGVPQSFVSQQPTMTMVQAVPQTTMMVPSNSGMLQSAQPFSSPGSVVTSTQTVTPPRTRVALGFSSVNVRMPVLRLIPFTSPSEVTTTTHVSQPPQPAVTPQTFTQTSMQVQAVPFTTQAVPQTTFFAQPQIATQAIAQPQMFVQQPQMLVQQPQFVQTQVAPQQTAVAVQQVATPATVQIQQAPPLAAPQVSLQSTTNCPPVSRQTLDQLQQELDKARALIK